MTNIEIKPTAILFGGANGAGKTSLYEVLKKTEDLGTRINIDEIVLSQGSWQNPLLQIKAAKEARKKIDQFISEGESFHFESTLSGASTMRMLENAKASGFSTVLHFVGIDGFDKAIERVRHRVEQGGHGIDDRALITRYKRIPENLRRILPFCDKAYFYDNTEKFRLVAIHRDGNIIDEDPAMPDWYHGIFSGLTVQNPFI